MMRGEVEIFAIGDRPEFGRLVAQMLGGAEPSWSIRYATYEQARALWATEALRSTSLFVLELFRRYPTGLRAEGIGVAQKLLDVRKPFVVVSPFEHPFDEKDIFWTPESSKSLIDVCQARMRGSASGRNELDMAFKVLSDFIRVPTGHKGGDRRSAD